MDVSVVTAAREDATPPEEAITIAAGADRLGFGELWIAENPTWDTFALATAIGEATENIDMTLGPLPVSVRDPATIIRGLSTVSALTHRTIGVAIGTSSTRVVSGLHGRSRKGATDTLASTASVLRRIIDGEEESNEGHPFRRRLPTPDGPLTVAAFGDRAISIAAQYADRMVLDLVTPQQVVEMRIRLEEAANKIDRPPPKLVAWLPAAVDPDSDSIEQVLGSVAGYLTVAGYDQVFVDAGLESVVDLARRGAEREELVASIPEDVINIIGLCGDTDHVRDRLEDYEKAGLDEVALVPATAGDPGGMRTLTAFEEIVRMDL